MRQIEKEEEGICDLSLKLKNKNQLLRKRELDCQTVELECRDEMEKIADMVGKKVLESILLNRPSSVEDEMKLNVPMDPVDPSIRLVKRGNWR